MNASERISQWKTKKQLNQDTRQLRIFFKLKSEKLQLTQTCQECEKHKKSNKISNESVLKPKPGGNAIIKKDSTNKLKMYENEIEQMKHNENSKKQKQDRNIQKSIPESPKPSTSGIYTKPVSAAISHEDVDVSEYEDDDTTTCCVCKEKSPRNKNNLQFLKIVTWAKCMWSLGSSVILHPCPCSEKA